MEKREIGWCENHNTSSADKVLASPRRGEASFFIKIGLNLFTNRGKYVIISVFDFQRRESGYAA